MRDFNVIRKEALESDFADLIIAAAGAIANISERIDEPTQWEPDIIAIHKLGIRLAHDMVNANKEKKEEEDKEPEEMKLHVLTITPGEELPQQLTEGNPELANAIMALLRKLKIMPEPGGPFANATPNRYIGRNGFDRTSYIKNITEAQAKEIIKKAVSLGYWSNFNGYFDRSPQEIVDFPHVGWLAKDQTLLWVNDIWITEAEEEEIILPPVELTFEEFITKL